MVRPALWQRSCCVQAPWPLAHGVLWLNCQQGSSASWHLCHHHHHCCSSERATDHLITSFTTSTVHLITTTTAVHVHCPSDCMVRPALRQRLCCVQAPWPQPAHGVLWLDCQQGRSASWHLCRHHHCCSSERATDHLITGFTTSTVHLIATTATVRARCPSDCKNYELQQEAQLATCTCTQVSTPQRSPALHGVGVSVLRT